MSQAVNNSLAFFMEGFFKKSMSQAVNNSLAFFMEGFFKKDPKD